ncbi:site-specific integrase [Methylobacterium soli]|nr:site-specific integrase [Methylobacterium soli]
MTARPWKHPKTGMFWLRRGVPADLRALVGKSEEKLSLRTKDPNEAKRLHAIALAELENRWSSLRAGPRRLSEREAHALAAPAYDWWLGLHRDNPSEQTFWRVDVADKLWAPRPRGFWSRPDLGGRLSREIEEHNASGRSPMEDWCLRQAAGLLKRQGLQVEEDDRLKVAKAIAAAVQRASLMLRRYARGEIVELAPETPAHTASHAVQPSSEKDEPPLTFTSLITGWAAETDPRERTKYEWTNVLRKLGAFIGHDDARRLTEHDLIAWKASLVAAGLSGKTIRDTNLAAVRRILGWAVDNRLLATNPAERVRIDVRKKPGESKRGFSDEEAVTLLEAAASEADPIRRWVPWICAFSGARLAEVCQLRVEDIAQIGDVWTMRIAAEAGSVKNVNSERTIPLHPALVSAGLPAFARARGEGPLFPSLRPDKFGKRGGTATKVLGPWVRQLGLTDKRLNPSHAWRHRFKTLGRRHQLAPDHLDAIMGHGRRSVADSYGEYEIEVMRREIEKIPSVQTK